MLVASSINEFTRRLSAPGSLYTFVMRGLHPLVGLVSAAALSIGYVFVSLASVVGTASYLDQFLIWAAPDLSGVLELVGGPVLAVLTGGAVVVLLVLGVRRATVTMLVIEVASISVVMAALILAGIHGIRRDPRVGGSLIDAWVPDAAPSTLGTGVVLAMVAFIGFESSTALGPEVQRRMRLIPRVLTGTVLLVGVVFAVGASLESALLSGLQLAPSADPVGAVLSAVGHRSAIPLVSVAAAASFFACATASSMALLRLLLAMSVDGVLPRALSVPHPRWQTPHRAAAVVAPVLCVVPGLLLALGVPIRSLMDQLIETSVTGYLVAYLLVCVAVLGFLPRIGEATVRPMVVAATAATALAVSVVAYAGFNAGQGIHTPMITLGVGVVAALGWWCLVRVQSPRRLQRLGTYDRPSASDVWWGPLPPIARSGRSARR